MPLARSKLAIRRPCRVDGAREYRLCHRERGAPLDRPDRLSGSARGGGRNRGISQAEGLGVQPPAMRALAIDVAVCGTVYIRLEEWLRCGMRGLCREGTLQRILHIGSPASKQGHKADSCLAVLLPDEGSSIEQYRSAVSEY